VFGSGYTFKWLLDPDPHSEWKIFAKTFAKPKIFTKPFAKTFAKTKNVAKTKIFATLGKLFSQKAKQNIRKIFAKIRKRKFSFQPYIRLDTESLNRPDYPAGYPANRIFGASLIIGLCFSPTKLLAGNF
jgi:hypothetical protein